MWLNNDFVDNMSDDTNVESYSDENFLYHPGLFGWCWKGRKKCEADREQKKADAVKGSCGSDYSSMNCSQLDDAYWCLDEERENALNSSTASRGARRVRDRALKVSQNLISQVEKYQDSRDCEGSTSGLDTALDKNIQYEKDIELQRLENERRMAEMQGQTNLMMMQQKMASDKEKKNLMYIGAGIIGIMLISMMMRKRAKVS